MQEFGPVNIYVVFLDNCLDKSSIFRYSLGICSVFLVRFFMVIPWDLMVFPCDLMIF